MRRTARHAASNHHIFVGASLLQLQPDSYVIWDPARHSACLPCRPKLKICLKLTVFAFDSEKLQAAFLMAAVVDEYAAFIFDMDETLAKYDSLELFKVR